MAGSKRDVTNSGIYDRLDSLRLEVKQDIQTAVNSVSVSQGRLEKKFDDLEAGRLTRAEGHISDLRLELQQVITMIKESDASSKSAERTLSGKFLALGAIGMVFLVAIVNLVFSWVGSRIK